MHYLPFNPNAHNPAGSVSGLWCSVGPLNQNAQGHAITQQGQHGAQSDISAGWVLKAARVGLFCQVLCVPKSPCVMF